MSTVVVTSAAVALAPVSLVPLALMFAAMGVVGFGAQVYSKLKDKKELAQAIRAMEKKLRDDITDEMGRVPGGGEREKLRLELENLKTSLDGLLIDEAELSRALEKLNALRLKVRAIELDEEHSKTRTASARASIAALRTMALNAGLQSWEKELNRLEGELEKISGLAAEERLFELQCLTEKLREMEKLSSSAAAADISAMEERRYVYTPASKKDKKTDDEESRARIVMEIRDWAGRIAMMDAAEGEKLRPMLDGLKTDTQYSGKLPALRRQVKTKWGTLRERAASTAFYRENLPMLIDLLQAPKDAAGAREAAELEKRCKALYGAKYIDRAFFVALYEDVMRFAWGRAEEIADHMFVQKVEQTLAEMGYELLTDENEAEASLSPGQVRYLDTPYDGYRVMVRADKETVSTRLVRVTETEGESLTPEQRQKDVETGKKWCRDLDGFLEKMREEDLPLDVTLRKEPEEAELMTVVDKNARARKKKSKKATKDVHKLQEKTV